MANGEATETIERQPGDEVPQKKWTPQEPPSEMTLGTPGNIVGVYREEPKGRRGDRDYFPGAWVIRFDRSPNEGNDPEGKPYGKANPHPVFAYLRSEGHDWGFSNADGKGGWGKFWNEGHFTHEEQVAAQRVAKKAQEMIGGSKEQSPAF